MVCPQKRSMIIKVSVFLLSTLLITSMATVVIAQTGRIPINTAQEDSILERGKSMLTGEGSSIDFLRELSHYTRDGCKHSLQGLWKWEKWPYDEIEITYDAEHQVFKGTVPYRKESALGYPANHLLLKVYFPKDDDPDWRLFEDYRKEVPKKIDINWLRQQKMCNFMWFTGTEYSFDQKTKKKTEEKLILVKVNGYQLQYKLYKKAWNLSRVPVMSGWGTGREY